MVKPYHKNPRKISDVQLEQLEQWLSELGDLSGIVHNIRTDEIIGGNQRNRIFDLEQCEIEIEQELESPDDQGTVALGYIVWNDHRYTYRRVDWDDRTAEQANIVANKSGGDWDWETLIESFDLSDLLEWGFSEFELHVGAYGDTSTDRDGQGVHSTWDQVKGADAGRVIIGEIETKLPQEVIDSLIGLLTSEYETNDRPIFETLETVMVAGIRAFEASDC